MASSSTADLWATLAGEAAEESTLWADSLRSDPERVAIFSPLAPERFALGLETIYEGYLVHYGESRLFAPAGEDEGILLGDYLYAHGLVRISETGSLDAVAEFAELISTCAHLQAEGAPGDGAAWIEACVRLGGTLEGAEAALAAHLGRFGPGAFVKLAP